jgi:hypothetical protein
MNMDPEARDETMAFEDDVWKVARDLLYGKLADLDRRSGEIIEVDGEAMLLEAADYLASLVVKASRVQAYLNARATGGRHEAAVKASNACAAKVRKAVGYTVGPDPLSF